MKPNFNTFAPYVPAIVLVMLGFVVCIIGALGFTQQNSQRNNIDEEIRSVNSDIRRMDAKIKDLNIQCNELRNPAALRQIAGTHSELKDISYNQVLRVRVTHNTRRIIRANTLSPREDAIELSKTISMR